MSAPEPTPFAVVEYFADDLFVVVVDAIRVADGPRNHCDMIAAMLNATVKGERQAAKAEALLDLAAWCATVSAAPNAIGPLFGSGVLSAAKMIGAEATSRAERAEKGDQ